ncbi:ABC transporter permease [Roseibium aquae]|uniref:ABC transporter permease n=1 Tax=Roseibium aquae TaxID=1323746 RepID=A0A916WU65_9HYPH|nr:DMT family transporter [Roseibium aquae]GGB32950.1 ABC transporter permease [Roseibium aquae]
MTIRNWFLLIGLGAIWGGSFLFGKVAVAEIPPFTLAFFRVFSACLMLHALLKLTGRTFPVSWQTFKPFLIMGFLNNAVPFSLVLWGQTQIGAGLASILNAATPLFTYVIAVVWLSQEQAAWHRLAGVLIGFAGVVFMLSNSLMGLVSTPITAQLACLGAALSYGFAAAYAKTFRNSEPIVSAAGQLTGSSLLLVVPALFAAQAWSPAAVSGLAWLNVLALGIVATGAAYLIYFRLLAEAGATNASLVTLIVPGTAIFFGSTLLGEQLDTGHLIGLVLLLTGLVILDGRAVSLVASKPWRST